MKKNALIAFCLLAMSCLGYAQRFDTRSKATVHNINVPTAPLHCPYTVTCYMSYDYLGQTYTASLTSVILAGASHTFIFGQRIVAMTNFRYSFNVAELGTVFNMATSTVSSNCIGSGGSNVTWWFANSATDYSIQADIVTGP
jgi:hypothetical protein